MKTLIILLLINLSLAAFGRASNQSKAINIIVQAADQAKVPRELLLSICWVESSYRLALKPHLDGNTHSYGLCQIKLETAQHMDKVYRLKLKATKERLLIPAINAYYAGKYLSYQLRRYSHNWEKAVTAYNKGYATTGKSIYKDKVFVVLYKQIEESK